MKKIAGWLTLFLLGGCAAAGTVFSAPTSESLFNPGDLRFWALIISALASATGLVVSVYQTFFAPKPQTAVQAAQDRAVLVKEARKAGNAAVMSGVSTRAHQTDEAEKTRSFVEDRFKALEAKVGASTLRNAESAGLNAAQIINILNSFGHENIPVELWETKLLESAKRLTDLEDDLARLTNDEPEIAALIDLAREAIDKGKIDKADKHLAEAVRRDEEAGERRLRRAAENEGRRGDLANSEGRYVKAADHFARAAKYVRPFDDGEWARLKFKEGCAAYERGILDPERGNLDRAIAAYREALEQRTRDCVPLKWAATQNNLGNALRVLGERGDDDALKDAISAYREALKEYARDHLPLEWAATQNNLGIALLTLGDRGDDAALTDAIAAFREALEERTRDRVPLDWAMTQNNLGNALRVLGKRGDGAALKDAIVAYREALKEWSRDRVPLEWAATQNNLGNALLTLGKRSDDTTLTDAIAAYREALKERTRDRVPLDWAMTQNNLGNALATLGERGDDAALTDAIAAYRQALKERTRDRVPLNWAMTQNNLGAALHTLGKGGDDAALTDAIAAYRDALKELTRDRVSLDWAMTQGNLANALETMGDRDQSIEHWIKSRNHGFSALEEFANRAPAYEAMAHQNLARVEAKLKAAGWEPPEGWGED